MNGASVCISNFSKGDADLAQDLSNICEITNLPAGQYFHLTAKDQIICIEKGLVRLELNLCGSPKTIDIKGPGDLISYADFYPSSELKIVALMPVETCSFSFKKFEELKTRYHQLGDHITQKLCEELKYSQQKNWILAEKSAAIKIAAVLLNIYHRFDGRLNGVDPFSKVDRQTFAELSGTVLATFSRAITQFENQQIIARHGKSIKILDLMALAQKAIGPD